MPVFDTPINANDASLDRITQQKLPVVLVLTDRPGLESTLNQIAKTHVGELLVVKIDASQNPQTSRRFQQPTLPAVITLKNGQTLSSGQHINAADLQTHVDYLLGKGPKPQAKQPSSNGKPVHVTDASFAREVLQSDVPVLVDFWAPWCGPCHMVAPILEKLAGRYAGQVRVAKLNVDDNQRTASQFQTMSIPTLIMFKNGQVVNRLVGAHPEPTIEQMVRGVLT